MLTWPPFLPLPQRAGNARSNADGAVRGSMAGGQPSARRRFDHVRSACPLVVMLTDDQLAAWDAWWHHTLSQGCAWFLAIIEGELGPEIHAARMAGGYQAESIAAARWRVSAAVELDNPPHIAPDDYAGLVLLGRLSVASESAALHALVHVTLPSRIPP